ncbi:MAG: hypothetical protein ABIS06_12105 [Vicinamibacterales bacterium]
MFSGWTGAGPDEHTIGVHSLATGERYDILSVGDTPRYAGGSHLTYGRLDTLIAVPWRLSKGPLTDVTPISLPEQPRLENEGAVDYAISNTGTLAYIAGGAARYTQRIVWVDRLGYVEPLPIPERDYEAVTLSPDGQRAIVQIREGKIGLWLFEFRRNTLTPLATAGGSSQGALWSADGSRVIYRGTRGGTRNLYWRAADGSGEEERLTTKPAVNQTPSSVSSDGEWLVFAECSLLSRGTLWLMRLRGDRTARELLRSAANGQISPDGRWLAYQSTTSGQLEVYLLPFPGPGARVAVSANGGENPLWSSDGRELFYISRDEKTMVVSITPGTTLSVSAPRVLYEGRYRPGSNAVTPFDISLDGRRFLRVQQVQPDRPVTRIDIVLNWLSELRK